MMGRMGRLADVYALPLALLDRPLPAHDGAGLLEARGARQNEAVFHLFFRRNPFEGGFAVACGLARAVDYLTSYRFGDDDLAYLATLTGNDGQPLFQHSFLRQLAGLRLSCDVDAMPEGTVVFPYEPLVRVRGPLMQAQLVETALLNFVNFETLIATKAARVSLAARGDAGARVRAAARAGHRRRAVGDARGLRRRLRSATSNVLAGRLLGLPVRGTHAHSWVMAFDDEPEAFRACARAQPNNGVFLVDTYDTLEGVRHAAKAALELQAQRAPGDRDPPRLGRPRLPEHRGAPDPRRRRLASR